MQNLVVVLVVLATALIAAVIGGWLAYGVGYLDGQRETEARQRQVQQDDSIHFDRSMRHWLGA